MDAVESTPKEPAWRPDDSLEMAGPMRIPGQVAGNRSPCHSDKEYGRQTTGGQILCGGYRRLDEAEGLGTYDEQVTAPVLSGIARCLTRLFPALRGSGVHVVRCWAGIMGFTADGLPLLGRYAPAPGLTVAAGFNGGGFSWGAAVGEAVAALLAGRDPGPDLEPFRPDRFHGGGGPAWANPFTAGEKNNPGAPHAEAAAIATPVDEAALA